MMFRKLFAPKETPQPEPAYDLGEVQAIAEQGRRLAIYDRATNLYAYWYLQLRGEEEISRAKRSGKRLCCLSLWAPDRTLSDQLARSLREDLRDHDLAGYLNNGHFVVLLPETGESGARIVVDRIRERAGDGVITGLAEYPADGETFDALLDAAKTQGGIEQSDVA